MSREIMHVGVIITMFWMATIMASLPALGAESLKSKPVVNVMDHGAKGDGKTNDAAAFRKACLILQEAGGGTLVIPKAVYIAGEQPTGLTPDHPFPEHRNKKGCYYKPMPNIFLKDVDGLLIEGNGATLKMADGLRIGSFDKDTGEKYEPRTLPFTDYNYCAAPWNIVEIHNGKNVVIRNLELDGNSDNMILGGPFNDAGFQCMANGIALYQCSETLIENIHTHHNGLDGIMVAHRDMKETAPSAPVTLKNIKSEYNARQGLSWVGGKGLTVIDSQFNHTGRGKFSSAPGAGLDIEAESSICRDGVFKNCEFINNTGCGIVADCGDGGYTTFENCTLWGNTSWAIWNRKPGMRFEGCNIYGAIVWAYGSVTAKELATQFVRCHFEDKEHPLYGVYRSNTLIGFDSCAKNVLIEDCDIVANKIKSCWITGGAILRNCRITHSHDLKNGDFQCLFRGGGLLENVRFQESFPEGYEKKHFIIGGIDVGDGVRVEGPVVRWGNWTGPVGKIQKSTVAPPPTRGDAS